MSSTSVFLARFRDRKDLLPALSRLESAGSVVNHEALEGHYDLFVSVVGNADSARTVRESLSTDDLERLDVKDGNGLSPLDGSRCHVLVCIEADEAAVADLERNLSALTETVWCVRTTGLYALLAALGADGFDQLDRVTEHRIRPLPGILRYRVCRVLQLDQI
jgi:DNA-binding Lrp family transcriptional regulator